MTTPQDQDPAAAPTRRVTRSALISRMLRLLERQIGQLESDDMTKPVDKEAALLGNMARTLEKLIELDLSEKARRPGRRQTRDLGDLRQKLAARIDQLRKG